LENLSNTSRNNAGGQTPKCMLGVLYKRRMGLSTHEKETESEFRDWNCTQWRKDKMPKHWRDGTADE
jgi:hypothetical protein